MSAPKDPYLHMSKDRWEREVLTVGALRKLLEGIDDSRHVVLDDGAGWYVNVEAVAVPERADKIDAVESDWMCVTFFPGTIFDSRQF